MAVAVTFAFAFAFDFDFEFAILHTVVFVQVLEQRLAPDTVIDLQAPFTVILWLIAADNLSL